MTRALAVDMGGSHVCGAAVAGQDILEAVEVAADSGQSLARLLPDLADALRGLRARHGGEFAGIGLGFCGLVDSRAGRVVSTNGKYADATEIDIRAWAQREMELPLFLENDTRMALLGERHAGAAQGSNDVVMMTLGTGIGTAVIMEGRLVRGGHAQGGCLGGHFTVVLEGRICSCGARGCFEAEASTYALQEVCETWPGFAGSRLAEESAMNFKVLFRAAEEKDRVAEEIRVRCVAIWKACALSLVHAYDPELLVLGGGVMQSKYPILEEIQDHLNTFAWTPWGKVRAKKAELGGNAGLMGAIPLLEERL